MSFAASQEGVVKSFGIHEVLDRIGAFLGPMLLYLVMLFKTDGSVFKLYSICLAVLGIPGAITIILLLATKHKFPNPEKFEPEPKSYVPFKMKKGFIFYIVGIFLFAFGFMDYSLIVMHVSKAYALCRRHLRRGARFRNSLRQKGRRRARDFNAYFRTVLRLYLRLPFRPHAPIGHRSLRSRHGRAGVDFESRRDRYGVECKPRTGYGFSNAPSAFSGSSAAGFSAFSAI